jgi:hypothetical protein
LNAKRKRGFVPPPFGAVLVTILGGSGLHVPAKDAEMRQSETICGLVKIKSRFVSTEAVDFF